MKPSIGIIGLGLLGSVLARRLLGAGFDVSGFDINEQACRELQSNGGRPVDSSRELTHLPRLIFCLLDSDIVEGVVSEIESGLRAGQVILDTTTGDPERTAVNGERLRTRGVDYLDATVLGSSEQAKTGDVLVMVGGRDGTVASNVDILSAIARRWFHVGPCGSGARMKLVVNLVLGLNRAVLAEGLNFALRCGLDGRAALQILRDGAAYSRVMDAKGEKMLTGDFTPQARLAQHLKDVGLILEQAGRVGARVPLSEIHAGLLRAVEEMGGGEDDNSAIIRAYQDGT